MRNHLALALAVLLACAGDDPTKEDTGTSADADADTDTDADADADADADTDTDTETDTDADPIGSVCPLDRRIGEIRLAVGAGYTALTGRIWDAPDPWVGAPALTTDTCAFYTFDPAFCGACPSGEVCAVDGTCVPARRALRDVRVVVRADGTERTFDADPTTGLLYGDLDLDPGQPVTVELEVDGATHPVPDLVLPAQPVDVEVTASGTYEQPGALEASWAPNPEGDVSTLIFINHHAAGPTFTTCRAPASSGSFRAEAPMIDPLAVVTGLEFQGVEHGSGAAVELPAGCVEVLVEHDLFVGVTFP